MTFQEKIFLSLMENIYTISLGKITFVDDTNSFADVEDLRGKTIPCVPIFHIGNSDINIKLKLKIGDIVPILHTKLDSSSYFDTGEFIENSTHDRFSKTNAFILPFCANYFHKGFIMPDVDIEITGDIKITGNIELEGKLTASDDVIVNNVSMKNHNHSVQVNTQTGAGATTNKPY